MRSTRASLAMSVVGVLVLAACSAAVPDGSGAAPDASSPVGAATPEATAEPTQEPTVEPTPEFEHLDALPVRDGLVVAFVADSGVVAEGAVVTEWTDLTGTLTLAPLDEGPALIIAGREGRDTVRFEGVARTMIADGADALPQGNLDRTVILAGAWPQGGSIQPHDTPVCFTESEHVRSSSGLLLGPATVR